jgi:hypothetical protein
MGIINTNKKSKVKEESTITAKARELIEQIAEDHIKASNGIADRLREAAKGCGAKPLRVLKKGQWVDHSYILVVNAATWDDIRGSYVNAGTPAMLRKYAIIGRHQYNDESTKSEFLADKPGERYTRSTWSDWVQKKAATSVASNFYALCASVGAGLQSDRKQSGGRDPKGLPPLTEANAERHFTQWVKALTPLHKYALMLAQREIKAKYFTKVGINQLIDQHVNDKLVIESKKGAVAKKAVAKKAVAKKAKASK